MTEMIQPLRYPAGSIDPQAPQWYLNRELTWLAFNQRVLQQAQDTRTPLLERVKFLAIVGANLDEFFMKRVGGLKQQLGARIQQATVDGRKRPFSTPATRLLDSRKTTLSTTF
jgi:polyphosphate kinase